MKKTKDKILSGSIKLFNEQGVGSIRLQQIADEAGISVGNLAYHFKSKDLIVLSVYDRVFEEFNEILGQYLQTPSFSDFDNQVNLYFEFFQKYQFYISDLFINDHPLPEIKKNWQKMIDKLGVQIKKRIEFHVKKGDLLMVNAAIYNMVSESLLMHLIFWIPQQKMRNKSVSLLKFKEMLWNNLQPYLTDRGQVEFNTMGLIK